MTNKCWNYLIILSLFLWGCNSTNSSSDPFADCKYSAPEAVFPDTLGAVVQQSFKLDQTTSIETVQFRNGLILELIQSGCNSRKQEYRFTLPPTKDNSPETTFIAAENAMSYLSGLSPAHRSLKDWARMIAQNRSTMKIAQPLDLGGGFSLTVDKVSGGNQEVVLVTMESSE